MISLFRAGQVFREARSWLQFLKLCFFWVGCGMAEKIGLLGGQLFVWLIFFRPSQFSYQQELHYGDVAPIKIIFVWASVVAQWSQWHLLLIWRSWVRIPPGAGPFSTSLLSDVPLQLFKVVFSKVHHEGHISTREANVKNWFLAVLPGTKQAFWDFIQLELWQLQS